MLSSGSGFNRHASLEFIASALSSGGRGLTHPYI